MANEENAMSRTEIECESEINTSSHFVIQVSRDASQAWYLMMFCHDLRAGRRREGGGREAGGRGLKKGVVSRGTSIGGRMRGTSMGGRNGGAYCSNALRPFASFVSRISG